MTTSARDTLAALRLAILQLRYAIPAFAQALRDHLDRPQMMARAQLERTVVIGRSMGMSEVDVRLFLGDNFPIQVLMSPDPDVWRAVQERLVQHAIGPRPSSSSGA